MKKLFLTLTLVLVLILAITACDSGNSGGNTPTNPNDPEHTHAYGEWETTKGASCLEEGTRVRRCACLEQESETIPATGHTFGEWIVDEAATCAKTGAKHHVCTICSVSDSEIIPTDNTVHTFDQKNVGNAYLKSEATTTCPAEYYYSCKCGAKGNETFTFGSPTGGNDPGDGDHIFKTEWSSDDEKHWIACIDLSCDARKNEAEHTFGEWVVDYAATCMKEGSRHRTCAVCGKSVSEPIPVEPNAHNYATIWTSDSENHWHKCQNSGCTSVSDQTSHTFGEWIVDTAATCMRTGTKHHTCTVCNKSESETIPVNPDAHNYATAWTTDDAYHWRECIYGCGTTERRAAHSFGAHQHCTDCDYEYYTPGLVFEKRGDVYGVFKYTGSAGEVHIPAEYQGIPVTRVDYAAFSDCENLTSVTIGNGVTSIENSAFKDCTGLTSITIPGSVTSIGEEAFYGCENLASVTLGNGLKTIGSGAFVNCKGLTSITIPDSVTSIGNSAFSSCERLASVTFGKNSALASIGSSAFHSCYQLAAFTVPDAVTSIGEGAFGYCYSLVSLTVGKSVTSIGEFAVRDCEKLIEICNRSALPLQSGSSSYGGIAYSVIHVYTPTSGASRLFAQEDYIFYKDGISCYLMAYRGTDTAITLPPNFNGRAYSIHEYAFYGCENLKSVTVPDSVMSIGRAALHGCKQLESLTIPFLGASEDVRHGAYFGFIFGASSSLGNDQYVPTTLKTVVITSTAKISGRAFAECRNITSVTIPSSVTFIDSYAFENCTSLKEVNFGGTKEQWNAITKGDLWNYKAHFSTVHCTDGDIIV